MGPRPGTNRLYAGFTLVEMVVVMAVLGILSVGIVIFIKDSSDGYVSVQDRESLASRGRSSLERIARGVRQALPGSVRVNADCLEYIPILEGGSYLSLPTATPAAQMKVVPVAAGGLNGKRIAVAPTAAVYALASIGELSPTTSLGPVDASGAMTLILNSSHRFRRESVGNRFFWVDTPISYCSADGHVWRYQNYGFNAAQPTPAALPASLPNRALLADTSDVGFVLSPPTLQRNAVVDIRINMQQGDVSFSATASVQVPNVP